MSSYRTHSQASPSVSSTDQAPGVNPDAEKGCPEMSADEKYQVPWQYYGYPALSKWMASANDFFLLRRFSPLQVRCLLHLQNQIAVKGRELERWDKIAMEQEPGQGNSGWIDCDPEALTSRPEALACSPRPRIIRELLPLLKEYNELVASFSHLKAMQTATSHQTKKIDNWFECYGEDAIADEEKHYKDDAEGDLITMISRPQYPLIAFLHQSRIIRRLFKLKIRSDRIASEETTYTSNKGLDVLAAMLCLTVGLSMTFASIWWLNFVNNKVYSLAIITASGTIMSLITWAAAGNRPFEILATFAAYMAVLMIYQQIVAPTSST